MKLTDFRKNGKKQVFKPVFGSVAELLEQQKEKFGGKDAVIMVNIDSGKEYSISYVQLAELVSKAASLLAKKGIQKGDRVAFAFENTPEILVLELAAGLLGASSVPLDVKRDTSERREFKLKDSGAKVFFEDEEEALRGIYASSLRAPYPPPLFGKSGGGPHPSLEDEYLLLYTSGTTALPKGVPLSLRSIMANAQGIAEWQELSEHDRFFIVLPLHHINSTTMSFATLLKGGTVILHSRYSASGFWRAASARKATLCSIVPTILHDLLVRKEEYSAKKYPLYFRRLLIGSAPVLPEETIQFMDTFGIDVVQGYGQTETALRVTGVPVDLPRDIHLQLTKGNSIGKELAYCNVTILKEDGKEALEKEEGEICIRGPVLGDGYWNNKEATEQEFFDGWFHSGDIGYYEVMKNEKYFFMKGRMKEIIIKGGVNISPAAVEDALLKNFPEINEVCVVGYPDSRMGEEIAAVITVQSLTSNKRSQTSEEDLAEKITRFGGEGKLVGLSRYEAPVKVFVLGQELPKTSTGKIQRVKVKEMVAEWVAKEKQQHLYCRLVEPHEKAVLQKAVEMNNKRWPVASDIAEFEQRAKNGYLIGVFDEQENLLGTLSALQMSSGDLGAAKTWEEATRKGTLQNNNPKGEILLCASITVAGEKSPTLNGKKSDFGDMQKLADAVIADYVKTRLDNVLRFHAKPKGGMQKGAKVIKILPNGRSEDTEAMGYNILVEYPNIDKRKKIVRSKNAPPSFLLVEHAMQLAKDLPALPTGQAGGRQEKPLRVVAFSRPAQFRLHLARALDPSINFEPKDKKAFTAFAKLVRKAA